MAWLILKRSNKKKKTSKRSRSKSKSTGFAASWTPERSMRALRIAGSITFVIALVVGWHLGEKHLKQYVRENRSSEVTRAEVTLADKPTWMGDWLDDDLSTIVAMRVSSDPLDGESLSEAAHALEGNPWVSRVHRIERQPEGKLVVHASFRKPVAAVTSPVGLHLVTQDATLLPGVYDRAQLTRLGLPMIEGVPSQPGGEGQRWASPELNAGLELVDVLRGEWYLPQIKAIHVGDTDRMGRIRLAISAHNGGGFIWGLPPGQEQAIEASTEVKRGRLRYYGRNGLNTYGETIEINTPRAWQHSPGQSSVGYTSLR